MVQAQLEGHGATWKLFTQERAIYLPKLGMREGFMGPFVPKTMASIKV
jgi:hypothetical protein